MLYEDECTLYRQPSVAQAYDQAGSDRPYARQTTQLNLSLRVVATLDAFSGRVLFKHWNKIGTKQLSAFYQFVRASYPTVQRIWLIQDNWPLHFHPDVLLGLEPQERWHPVKLPRHWTKGPTQEARRQWGTIRLPIQIVLLPTYASWWNRIEKALAQARDMNVCMCIPGRTSLLPGARKSVPSSSNLPLAPPISCIT